MSKLVVDNPWERLRRYTPARIALGRAGVSLPTKPLLEFQLAHALARDAVHLPLDDEGLTARLEAQMWPVVPLRSAAGDRQTYLQRPDLGRRLDENSREALERLATRGARGFDIAFVVADGLSARAVNEHAPSMLAAIRPRLEAGGWRIAPLALVEQGRVAIGDDVGALMGAAIVVVLIGERPGLSSPDSLGLYLTYAPRAGLTDEARNCISNVRPQGLSFEAAAHRLFYLLEEARRRKLSGVELKDESDMKTLSGGTGESTNFLTRG